jgi:hypothetical protein
MSETKMHSARTALSSTRSTSRLVYSDQRTSENSSSTRPRVYGLHLLATHTGSFSVVVLFILFFVLFAGNAGRQDKGSHCNSSHPKHPPQKIPSTQLFARHKSTPLTMCSNRLPVLRVQSSSSSRSSSRSLSSKSSWSSPRSSRSPRPSSSRSPPRSSSRSSPRSSLRSSRSSPRSSSRSSSP